jgi:hypothetical protein
MPLKELEALMLETVGRGHLSKGFNTATWHPYGVQDVPSVNLQKISNRWKADLDQVQTLIPVYIEAKRRADEDRQERDRIAREIENAHRIARRDNRPLDVYRHRIGACSYWCQICNKPARDIDDYSYECHSCRDWTGCGGDCTVVAVECGNCSTVRVLNGNWADRHQGVIREYAFNE